MAKHGVGSDQQVDAIQVGTYVDCLGGGGHEGLVVSVEGQTAPENTCFVENVRLAVVAPYGGKCLQDVGSFDYAMVSLPLHATQDESVGDSLAQVDVTGFFWLEKALYRRVSVLDADSVAISPPDGKVWVRKFNTGVVEAMAISTTVVQQPGQLLDWKLQ